MDSFEKRRVLVVEDIADLSDSYRFHLERAGYVVDVADQRATAVTALRSKLYDIALVDLMLERNEITHKGGLDVLDFINELHDGTRTIVVSATQDIRDAIASHSRGIASFLMKGEFEAKDLVDAVAKALDGHRRPLFGNFPSLVAYLAAPDVTPLWEGRIKTALDCGYDSTQKILWNSLRQYLPLLRRKDGTMSLEVDKDHSVVVGSFWSKAIGEAIWFSAAGTAGKLVEPPGVHAQRIAEYSAKDVVAAIWQVEAPRDEFVETIRDQPHQQE